MAKKIVKAIPSEVAIDTDKLLLLIIDMQRDFLETGGIGDVRGGDVTQLQKITPRLSTIRSWCASFNFPIVFTREGYASDLSDCPRSHIARQPDGQRIGDKGKLGRMLIRGEPGHSIIPELTPLFTNELVLDKASKDCFHNTDLECLLRERGIQHVLVTGVTTNVCVGATIRGGCDRGFDMIALSDCCAAYDADLHEAELRAITAHGGIFGWVSDSTEFMRGLFN